MNITPTEIRAVAEGTADRRTLFAVLTSTTCGEACWHAREEVCRCECGGRNHGCLKTGDGVRPTRSAKIDGVSYELAGVAYGRGGLQREADKVNHWTVSGWRGLDPMKTDGKCARLYYYTWSETDSGAPARLKNATPAQLAKWEELKGFTDGDKLRYEGVRLLWVRRDIAQIQADWTARRARLQADTTFGEHYHDLEARRLEADKAIVGEITTAQALNSFAQ